MGSSAVVVKTNAVLTINNASFKGPLTLENGAQAIMTGGNFTNEVQITSGGNLRLTGGTVAFKTNVTVAVGGKLDVTVGTTLVLSGTLTNAGSMLWVTRYNTFDLQGIGRVENQGLWELYGDQGCPGCASESVVRVPVNVAVGGKLLMDTNTFVNFSAGSSLTVSGDLEVQSGARLRVDGTNPARDMTLQAGSLTAGGGTLQLEGGCRLVYVGDTTLKFGLVDFKNSSSVFGSNLLTIAAGSLVRFDHSSTLSGPVTVAGSFAFNNAAASLRINGLLTLKVAGVITNSGTLSVAALVDEGGSIVGNAPVIVAGNVPSLGATVPVLLRIEQALPSNSQAKALAKPANASMVLKWTASQGNQFGIEVTTDLRVWTNQPAVITEPTAGSFQAALPVDGAVVRFYRLRRQ